MTSWAEFEKDEPEFAATVRERFGMYKHHVLGTVRRDGAPRLSGLEADFRFEQMWLGMMPSSMKARDLLRDPRFSIFANPGEGAEMTHGDVRVSGRAIEVVDEAVKGRYAAETSAPEPFHLFRVELDEVTRTGVEGEEVVIRVWRPGAPVRTIRRGNDAASVAPAREGG
ncbi:pyridoxamine 5'-phosphate oxidase family protein [Embleya sp. NPDC005575]|uniref:pyridoxamine 5'-phosphate oxidase family protein n=1 Tax=Embleya sp. NPDC005575 TaxID=3156892 RepID=UPI0033A6B515